MAKGKKVERMVNNNSDWAVWQHSLMGHLSIFNVRCLFKRWRKENRWWLNTQYHRRYNQYVLSGQCGCKKKKNKKREFLFSVQRKTKSEKQWPSVRAFLWNETMKNNPHNMISPVWSTRAKKLLSKRLGFSMFVTDWWERSLAQFEQWHKMENQINKPTDVQIYIYFLDKIWEEK